MAKKTAVQEQFDTMADNQNEVQALRAQIEALKHKDKVAAKIKSISSSISVLTSKKSEGWEEKVAVLKQLREDVRTGKVEPELKEVGTGTKKQYTRKQLEANIERLMKSLDKFQAMLANNQFVEESETTQDVE